MRMKKYKIKKTEEFEKQMNELSEKDQKEVNKIINEVAKNPLECKGSMSLFDPASVKELKQWANEITVEDIDLVFEYLKNKNCLNKNGKKLAKDFWEQEIREDQNVERKTQ